MTSCLGPLCGRFKNEFSSSSSSDEDEEDEGAQRSSKRNMAAKKRKQKGGRNRDNSGKQAASSGHTSFALKWAPHMYPIRMPVEMQGTLVEVKRFKVSVVNKKNGLTANMRNTLCKLSQVHEIELIKCQLDEIPPSLSEITTLRILRFSGNKLPRLVANDLPHCDGLEQLILDSNGMYEVPPAYFSLMSFPALKVLNLSNNALTVLPPDFGTTTNPNTMRLIDLSRNSLQSIPDRIMRCYNLEELDLSHNQLRFLPEPFEMKMLQKLFVSFNELTKLPDDLGKCERLVKIRIVRNQIRALPDSSINLWQRKGGLLEELLVDRNPLQMPSSTAFELGDGSLDRAFELLDAHLKEKAVRNDGLLAIEAPEQSLEAPAITDDAPSEIPSIAANSELEDSQAYYYFAHCYTSQRKLDHYKVSVQRAAESAILLCKRNSYLDRQAAWARQLRSSGQDLPAGLELLFLESTYRDAYKGAIPPQALDLYFCLIVLTMKPMFKTAAILFDCFEVGNKGYMARHEWDKFCYHLPFGVDAQIQAQVWELLTSVGKDRVNKMEFVAAWHIHDIELKDPWIEHMTCVLRLDYYKLTTEGLKAQLGAKRQAAEEVALQDRDAPIEFGAQRKAVDARSKDCMSKDAAGKKTDILSKVSLNDKQYTKLAALEEDERSQCWSDSDKSMCSEELSDGAATDSDEGSFEVQRDALLPRAVAASQSSKRKEGKGTRVVKEKDISVAKDVAMVRRRLRDAFRSMPRTDFDGMINFLLRGLQTMSRPMLNMDIFGTSWHVDDPAFKQAMGDGSNKYTQRLLVQMGFVQLNDTLWIWPSVHLGSADRRGTQGVTWGVAAVPSDCPGNDRHRLETMISMLKSCQSGLQESGSNFTGHFRIKPHDCRSD